MTQTHYKRWGLLWRCKDGSVRKPVNAMNHLNRVKDKNHTVILIIGGKSLDKLQRAFTIKALSKLRSDGNHINKINSVKKFTASITHNGRRLVTFPLRSGTSQRYPVLPLLFNIALEFLLSAVQSLSRVRLFSTPWITARQASLSITNSRSSPKLMCTESVMPSSHLILCRPLLLLPPIPSSS